MDKNTIIVEMTPFLFEDGKTYTKEELQEKVDKLEKKVEDLTQKLRQRAII